MSPSSAHCLPVHTSLGESPVWDGLRQALWFVDIEAQRLHRLDWPDLQAQQWSMPGPVASIGLCDSGRLLLAIGHSLHLFDPIDGSLRHFTDVERSQPGNRLNDGKVAPDGTFWIGSMDDVSKSKPTGALYQVFADGRVVQRVTGLVTSNGLAWSADGGCMYHSDSRGRFIKHYRYADGELAGEQVIARPSIEQGRPDGAATDMEGGYWSAGVSAGCLNRYTEDGLAVERVQLPVAHPTMPCFGGPNLRTLFVTSLVTDSPTASGTLLCFDAGVAGVPVARFPL